ncbi:MAG TPA: OmpW family outer membrane protein [Rhodocyclaceae bacterium]|nr:OmpW family outer membrane protein [Rhodocyclaceae bacterium]
MKMVKLAIAVAAVLGSSAAFAQQAEGNFMMRVRAVDVQWNNQSSDVRGNLGLKDNVVVDNKVIPEIDFTYFFTKNIAAELILTYPQKFDVKAKSGALGTGGFSAGTFKGLPPTLTLQYHFAPEATFRPYVGAGINYTLISDVKLTGLNNTAGTGGSDLSRSSTGGALQVGFDYKVGPNSYVNLDIKKVYMSADLSVSGLGKVSKLTLDPLLVGVGYGFKF